MPNFLVIDVRTGAGGSTCQAYQYVNATPTALGNTFGVNRATLTSSTFHSIRNQIIQFQGELFALTEQAVFQKDDPTSLTGNWTSVLTLTNPEVSGDAAAVSGLYPVEIDGTTQLVCVYSDATAGRWRWIKYDGTTWSQAPDYFSTGTDTPTRSIYATQIYRNQLVMTGFNNFGNMRGMIFDPATNSFQVALISADTASQLASMCVYDERLFMMVRNGAGNASILEYQESQFLNEVVDTGVAVGTFSTAADAKWALFTDNTYMYALFGNSASAAEDGWECFRYDTSLAQTDISTEVLPSIHLSSNNGGTSGDPIDQRFEAVYDQDTDVENPVIYLYYSANGSSGASYTMYQWNYDPIANPPPDVANLMTTVDTGGDKWHSLPAEVPAGGCRIWTTTELDVEITGRSRTTDGEVVSFVAYGGGTGRTFKLYYQYPGEAIQEATLTTPVTGGSATFNGVSNQVENIAADGTTTYSIVWDVSTDSITDFDFVTRYPEISP